MTTNDDRTIGERLGDLRRAADMSVSQLARAAKLTENTIYRLEGKGRKPRADTVQALAAALDVSADELLSIDKPSQPAADLNETKPSHVGIPLRRTITQVEGEYAVPIEHLPSDVSHDQLDAVPAADDACAPEVQPDDVAIVQRDADWSDGQLVAVADPEGVLLIRYAWADGDDHIRATGTSPAVHMSLPADSVWGRVRRLIRSYD